MSLTHAHINTQTPTQAVPLLSRVSTEEVTPLFLSPASLVKLLSSVPSHLSLFFPLGFLPPLLCLSCKPHSLLRSLAFDSATGEVLTYDYSSLVSYPNNTNFTSSFWSLRASPRSPMPGLSNTFKGDERRDESTQRQISFLRCLRWILVLNLMLHVYFVTYKKVH